MEKPQHLNAVGVAAWDRAVRECSALKIDPDAKYDVLERYAVTYQLWLECQARIRKEGQCIARGSELERNPRMTDYHRLTELLGRLRGELGIGPLVKRKPVDPGEEPESKTAGRVGRLIYKIPRVG